MTNTAMDNQQKIQPVPEEQQNDQNSQGMATRRRFLKGAAISTPVLLTLASRPVLGAECSLSGFLSGNLSKPDGGCFGRSPGYWKQFEGKNNKWPSDPTITPDTLFTDVFAAVWKDESGTDWDSQITLGEVLWLEGNDDMVKFGFHATAAFLNAYFRPDGYPYPTTAYVINLVNDVIASGDADYATTVKTFFESTYV